MVLFPILQKLESALPLNELAWDTAHGESRLPEAAVLVALTNEEQPQVLLGRRALHLPHHPGEIAFPGGKRELVDATPWITATREACEEVGIGSSLIHALGELKPLVTRTGFEVHPCISSVPINPELEVDYGEFDSVFFSPLSVYADKNLFRLEAMMVDGAERRVPHYQVGEDNVWGVTAAVLAMVANLAYDAGLDLQRNWETKP